RFDPCTAGTSDAPQVVDWQNPKPSLKPHWVNVTPMSQVSHAFTRCPDAQFSNAYTRLVIVSRLPEDSSKNQPYDYIDPRALARIFWGVHFTMNLTAQVTVGSFAATVPLMTIDHTSNRSEGEQFARVVYHGAEKFPLFLLRGDGSNAVAAVHFEVKSTDEIN